MLKDLVNVFLHGSVTTSSFEVMLVLAVLTFCLFFHATRTGLIVAYVYVYRMGWLFLKNNYNYENTPFVYVYSIFGLIILGLAIASMMRQPP